MENGSKSSQSNTGSKMKKNKRRKGKLPQAPQSFDWEEWYQAVEDDSIPKFNEYLDFTDWLVTQPKKELETNVVDPNNSDDFSKSASILSEESQKTSPPFKHKKEHAPTSSTRNNESEEQSSSNSNDMNDQIISTDTSATTRTTKSVLDCDNRIPESVLRYERQMKKARQEGRLGKYVGIEQLKVIYIDEHIVVIDKPSGVLCVPGLNRNPYNITQVVFDAFGCESDRVDKMIVHRLDMDTSGLVMFARTNVALSELHRMFRDFEVKKKYEALLCGNFVTKDNNSIIDLPLQRDHRFPPFMRVATPESEREASQVVKDLQHHGWKKLVKKKPKPSQTQIRVLNKETLDYNYNDDDGDRSSSSLPVTRVALIPLTGRTHQLRVHCAAMGHPIVADQSYGFLGEAAPNGGYEEEIMENCPQNTSSRASLLLQQDIDNVVKATEKKMCLHAKEMLLVHPVTSMKLMFQAPSPF
eukprot:CAMPEP_0195512864 /NCGR_PEP_ID=MMETSP0794_2-20130614/4668_1 /TAXON_ID=515487 /ORGANISM="Stephanopyxis turris, Strain CCMP 815" /LENGTH=469 /DNA_ID=CAMNT_0040640743 /DNA_START=166 /DNA_END=1575 /DNA_ORIENTATION=+